MADERVATSLGVRQGVLVQSVDPSSSAGAAGLRGTRRTLAGIAAGLLRHASAKCHPTNQHMLSAFQNHVHQILEPVRDGALELDSNALCGNWQSL